ncbi:MULTISPECIES: ABC transporter ATP-binding protein [Metallosphaera]|uniref:Oligopeptide/dipeptide ABC transporter, ATPase subunit n=3 Tax=Metallosphaera TaxID=41980 RepID=A4YFL3_METS5|nr:MULTISPECIES: ABC transporter ATP-binding protein [Metallosphaera]ABP95215.1 oligopeptide/dipeptide ABC transporter, ATPase subunit [Metallosphaera sedula DSM 5348]AIM27201.1 oligopeptide/dipeptide ABC transporter, ATPase subunit [Metallosphaera sedula]AKV74097.1 peptide ABC transporter ATPase [Metallosphaera sedula]AKV76337.1 peptide ABC transporter ATPase [Metallosphaera sedula]AKV78588.1 peptide ABC transporter ATPase [Metallosphaera sedula]
MLATYTNLVETENLGVEFTAGGRVIRAVDGVSLGIGEGETFTVIGESGSGKSTLALAILKLIKIKSGKIFFKGQDITKLKESEMRSIRREMQIVLQDPYLSLDPRLRVGDIVKEPLLPLGEKGDDKVDEVLSLVGLDPGVATRFPHEFSGGQRQRIAIARSLISDPKFIVLDEPTSNLDVSIQAQILNLLLDIQERRKVSYLLITHNMLVAKYMSDNVAVMYSGKIVERGSAREVIGKPLHPYTMELLNVTPTKGFMERIRKMEFIQEGEIPIKGCRYANRCRFAKEVCRTTEPTLKKVSQDHEVACFLY